VSDASRNPDDYCYRHPDRLSFVLCERCGRTICLECQNHVDGRVLCPDDATRSNVTMLPVNRRPKKPPRVRRQSRLFAWVTDSTPIITYSLLVLLVFVFIVDLGTGGLLTLYLGVFPTGLAGVADVLHQPWSLLTSMILPGSVFGLLINGYSTYALGTQLERLFDRRKFITLYIVSGFGAAVVSFLLNQSLTYSIGAVFGLVAATVVVARRMGSNMIFLYVTCAISFVFAIVFGQWAGAIGGALAGLGTTFTYLYDDGSARHKRSRFLMIGVIAVFVVLAVVRALVFGG